MRKSTVALLGRLISSAKCEKSFSLHSTVKTPYDGLLQPFTRLIEIYKNVPSQYEFARCKTSLAQSLSKLDDTYTNTDIPKCIDYIVDTYQAPHSTITSALRRVCEFTFSAAGSMYRREQMFPLSFEKDLKPYTDFLSSIKGLDIPRVLSTCPWVLERQPMDFITMKENILWLRSELQLDEDEMAALLNKNAMLFLQSPAKLDIFFAPFKNMGFSMNDIKSIAVKSPLVFNSRSSNIVRSLQAYRDIFDDDQLFRSVICRFPLIVWAPADAINEKLEWMKKQGSSMHMIRKSLTRFPLFMCAHIDTIRRKARYLEEDLGGGRELVVNAIASNIQVFNKSLQSIEQNVESLRKLGFEDDTDLVRLLLKNPILLSIDHATPNYAKKVEFLQSTFGFKYNDGKFKSLLTTYPFITCYSLKRMTGRAAFSKHKGREPVIAGIVYSDRRFLEIHNATPEEYQAFVHTLPNPL